MNCQGTGRKYSASYRFKDTSVLRNLPSRELLFLILVKRPRKVEIAEDYCGSCFLLYLLLESEDPLLLALSPSSNDDFCLRWISSTYRRQKDSLSFLAIFEYLGSPLSSCLAVDQEFATVLPSVSLEQASTVITSANNALNSCAHR